MTSPLNNRAEWQQRREKQRARLCSPTLGRKQKQWDRGQGTEDRRDFARGWGWGRCSRGHGSPLGREFVSGDTALCIHQDSQNCAVTMVTLDVNFTPGNLLEIKSLGPKLKTQTEKIDETQNDKDRT